MRLALTSLLVACCASPPRERPEPERARGAKVEAGAGHPEGTDGPEEDDAEGGATLTVLGWQLEGGARAIPALRPGSGPDFQVDPDVISWEGPPVVEGRARFAGRRLVKASVIVAGRADCDRLLALLRTTYGETVASACAEHHFAGEGHLLRYQERSDRAWCLLGVTTGEKIESPRPEAPSLGDAPALDGVPLGAARATVAGLVPVAELADGEVAVFTRPAGGILGADRVHGLEYRFWRDALEEVDVRAVDPECDAIRATLVGRYGEGEEVGKGDLSWRSCGAGLLFQRDDDFRACRVALWSPALRWERAESLAPGLSREIRAKQAEIARFVVHEGGRVTVTEGIFDWLPHHPEFVDRAPTREPAVNGRTGEPQGFHLVGVAPDGVEHALGLREGDWVVEINGDPATEFVGDPGLQALDLVVRRSGQQHELAVGFDPGVFARLHALRPRFP